MGRRGFLQWADHLAPTDGSLHSCVDTRLRAVLLGVIICRGGKMSSGNGLQWTGSTPENVTAGVIAHYVMDTSSSLSAGSDRPLTAETGGNNTYYLYGLGAIGEKTTAWNFSLPDGTNTPRQLSNNNGDITLSARYTPWGDTLELNGTGNFTFGYLGGVLDATTGLLYVGNGQYYDPQTGRFLTRDAKPNNSNPYVPWDPSGAIIAPLGIVALFAGKKKKGSKAGTFLVLLLVLGSVGMTLAACGLPAGPVTATLTSTPGAPIQYTIEPSVGPTISGTLPASTVAPTETPSLGSFCAELIPTLVPTPNDLLYINDIMTVDARRKEFLSDILIEMPNLRVPGFPAGLLLAMALAEGGMCQ